MTNVQVIQPNQEEIEEIKEEISNTLTFPSGLFHGKEVNLRITEDNKYVSVFDVIEMVGEQIKPKNTWYDIEKKYNSEVALFSGYFKFKGRGQKETPCVNATGLVKLLMWIPGEKAKQFRSAGADILVRYLGGDTEIMEDIEEIEYIKEEIEQVACSSNSLSFPSGLFHGKEVNLRITENKQYVSVYDVIQMVGEQKEYRKVWERVKNEDLGIVTFCHYSQFGKTKKTPVINAKGLVLLLMQIPGEKAKQFRSAGADILVRYLGGDTSLIGEIEAINQVHIENPNNPAAIFRNSDIVQQRFTRDQLNNSNKLLEHFGNKTDVFYMVLFDKYAKIGIVPIRYFKYRHSEHVNTLGDGDIKNICIYLAIQCKDVAKIESEFKKTILYKLHKIDLPKNDGSNYTEIIELNENITAETIKNEVIKVAGDRILDPPSYNEICGSSNSIEIEKEKTKQIEEKEKTKQIQAQVDMKKMELDMKKLDFEIMKFNSGNQVAVSQEPIEETNEIELWCKENIEYSKDSIIQLKDICEKYFGRKANNTEKSQLKKQVEKYIQKYHSNVNYINKSHKINNESIRCWLDISLKY